jgi:molybdopterin synthase catalytic subunit
VHVQILLFAQMRLEQGAARIEVELPDGATVRDAIARVAADHPAVARHLGSCLVAVGLEYVEPAHVLHGGEEVSLVPPVQGG